MDDISSKVMAAPDQLQLAIERTYLANERTLMAWIRTATSLITFGFTLYKFFFYLHMQEPTRHDEQVLSARTFGLFMIAIGLITLALATVQHRRQIQRLQTQYPAAPLSLATVLAGLIAGLGLLGFTAAIFRL